MEQQKAPTMGSIALKYGLIFGAIEFVVFLGVTLAGLRQTWPSLVIDLVLLVVLMVLAHRDFKKTREGIMTYGQGLGLGTLLAVVAAVLICVLLFIYVSYINTRYPAAALQIQQAALEERGLTGAQLDQALTLTRAMLTPTGMLFTSLISGIFTGFVVALIVSAITRVSDPRAVI